jgi:hypothetical protein
VTPNEVSKVVFMVFAAFPQGDKLGPERAKLYEQMLVDLEFETCKAAVVRLLQSSKFLPTIAEIREAARACDSGPKRTGLEAWGDVVHAVRYQGSYRVPKFSDPLVEHVVACMSWPELCLGENEPALRARFVEAYEAAQDRELREKAVSPSLRLQGQELRRIGPSTPSRPALAAASLGLKPFEVDGRKSS